MNDIVISVKNLTKRFGNFTAVDNISFDVKRGEIFGFLGANGAGKTTAMRMLCGLSYPTSGSGSVAGFDVMHEGEMIKRHIGYMSQRFSLYNDLTVWENMRLFAGIYGMTKKNTEARATELLSQLNFLSEKDTLVGSLPLGWKQKLSFVIATIHSPEVVFLDEPTGGVDPITRRQFGNLYIRQPKVVLLFLLPHTIWMRRSIVREFQLWWMVRYVLWTPLLALNKSMVLSRWMKFFVFWLVKQREESN